MRPALLLLAFLCGATQASDRPDWTKGMPEVPECSPVALRSSEWMGIPVMPGLVEAKVGGVHCVYTVRTPISQAEAWYLEQMARGGWKSEVKRQNAIKSISDTPIVRIEFRRAREVVNVVLFYSDKEKETIVMLRRLRFPWEGA
jgi:hypothetical protein